MSSKNFLPEQRNDVNHLNYYYFASAFTESELALIKEIADKIPKQKASVGTEGNISEYRISDVAWINDSDDTEWLYSKIADYAKIANKEMWNFDIWGYQDNLQYTNYYGDGGGHYDWHLDLGPGLSNRKLSVVLQLSEGTDYDGGELQINPGGSILSVPKQLGLLCFFPSFLLHRVTPVTKGIRKSFVLWLGGGHYR
jgi:PKHD-type hydroxylase